MSGAPAISRETLRGQIQRTDAATLLPHQRRDGLIVVVADTDILDVAMAIAGDDKAAVQSWLENGTIYKPSLAEVANWCVDTALVLQYLVLQPYVVAQPIHTNLV